MFNSYFLFTGISAMKAGPDSALTMADKFIAHLAHTNLGTEKFRAIQLGFIEVRLQKEKELQ